MTGLAIVETKLVVNAVLALLKCKRLEANRVDIHRSVLGLLWQNE